MRRKWSSCEMAKAVLIFTLLAMTASCDGARRAQRRKDTARAELPPAAPSAETLTALAHAMGAAGFEHREGRTLVKRLIQPDSQPDQEIVEHQGVIGKANVDFPAYPTIPNTGFNCKNVPTGYYADLETDCQVFHICDTSRKISFLCPNGTIFSQSHLICDWWFKVDCASAPALYESSAEYYSNEQKKSQKITQSLSKKGDLQIFDSNARAESRRSSVNVPSTTERLLRHRQRLQTEAPKATARSFHALFADVSPTLKTESTTTFEKRRRNLVQLIANNFGNAPARTTLPTYSDASTYRTDTAAGDYNSLKEMQVAAESASFTNNKNRQYLQDYNNKNYRPYPVYTPNVVPKANNKPKNNPTLTTLYDFREKNLNQVTQEVPVTTKRPTLLPYTKSYASTFTDRREPYTRPGVSSLKEFLEKERNKTLTASTTEKIAQITARSDQFEQNFANKVTIETRNNFESATKIPQTTRNQYFGETSSDRFDTFSSTNFNPVTTEPSYQERRERLMRKLNLETFSPTEATVSTTNTEKYYGDLPNRPGLVVPPSLTPKTLHTLAIYYATALDNLSTTAPPEDTSDASTTAFEDYEAMEEALPALFSQHTINKYSRLFNHGTDTSELLEEIKLDPNGTYNELADDLAVQQSQNPLATSPQIRELAQVFTHALSAYLQDPIQFRKVLSDIRPTHPSFGDILSTTEESYNTEPTTTVNEEDDEILGFSDDNKVRPPFASLRDGKALNIATDYPTTGTDDASTTPNTISTEYISTTAAPISSRNPFRCCGRISASYTTASTPIAPSTTPFSFTNTVAANVNTLATNNSEIAFTTTEDSYLEQRYGGFQNNSNNSPYGKDVISANAKPLNDYVEVTNLPSAWGVDVDATLPPITNSDNLFESKKIRTTTALPETTPIYFTEGDSSIEFENEEELQRAHSQSFVTPQNNIRTGKQINFEETKTTVRKPSEDLEAPTVADIATTTVQTTAQPSTTIKEEESATTVSPVASIFTSPGSDKTSEFSWPTTFENWQSTVIDPITLNDGLSPSGPDQGLVELASQTNAWAQNTFTTPATETKVSEQAYSSSVSIELTTPRNSNEERVGRLVKDPTSTEAAQDLTTIADTVVEKAKEIMGGMNATTTEKLMNVMKKTKSKTVRRLILLLVQTCDDDHNTTAEASKKALLEALMAVSQKDMDEIAKEEGATKLPTTAADFEIRTTQYKRSDKIAALEEIRPKQFERRGKSINFDPTSINSLSSPSTTTTENVKTTTEVYTETIQNSRTTPASRRGVKKFLVRTTPVEQKATKASLVDNPIAEARVAPNDEAKTPADTRALELLRSLYTIAARWG